ncbi:UDP-2,4-diacetamido-2,4,6-trideoxy-beta-L-altropyranose hydrolase [Terrimonas sp. NA20]|uniref:UDP-2,4-diacetamido-2,4, 6-trideoxy-beta-L-altropyranose hydrolase n=1 Tax=Terrimonas ginsenosidimutans TaxID=2908004 RepID=A0ABS9KUS5_9BACT|nr:UDP-2,4-diacetamido-2,4,6-trideoxy-beta-L-altropyranose hydrolase [Terrimonas ginsenosidimutans]MCG2616070.1 UDP-2,4-diacetamido-2,4,6-trideoxy-beta-L-altropyranose hydrolase [Terrimonas ginsenosidimutans]
MHKQSDKGRVIFRTVGSNKIGLGHIVRSMAVADLVKYDFKPVFWLNRPDDIIINMITPFYDVRVFDFANNRQEIEEIPSELTPDDILVLDGYQFDSEYQQALKREVKKMVCIDDLAHTHFWADIVINHGHSERVKRYETEAYTRLLTGADYVILREPFMRAAREVRAEIEVIDTIFICMGGADPFNATNKVLCSSIKVDFIKRIIVVTGSAYSFGDEMQQIIERSKTDKEIIIRKSISADEMVSLIHDAQIAVCPASSVSLEVISVKCGLMTGMVVDNQLAIHDMITESGCAVSVGDFNNIDSYELSLKLAAMNDTKLVNELLDKQARFIDGQSGNRILNEFKAFA